MCQEFVLLLWKWMVWWHKFLDVQSCVSWPGHFRRITCIALIASSQCREKRLVMCRCHGKKSVFLDLFSLWRHNTLTVTPAINSIILTKWSEVSCGMNDSWLSRQTWDVWRSFMEIKRRICCQILEYRSITANHWIWHDHWHKKMKFTSFKALAMATRHHRIYISSDKRGIDRFQCFLFTKF